jgi:hypothetical protein
MNPIRFTMTTLLACLLAAMTIVGQVPKPNGRGAVDGGSILSRPVVPDIPSTSLMATPVPQAAIPRLMKLSGALHDASGKPLTGPLDVTFSLYSTESGGDAIWYETQSLQADDLGPYSALLAPCTPTGCPSICLLPWTMP